MKCPTCGIKMTYCPSLAHDTPPDFAMEPYWYCENRKCNQRDLEVYPPYAPLRTRWGRLPR